MTKLILSGIAIVLVAGGVVYYVAISGDSSVERFEVRRGDIIQEAFASGNVAAPSTIDLKFQNPGKIVFLGVESGEIVSAGDVLARQDTSVLSAQLAQAEAAVAVAQAELASLREGTRLEAIAVTKAQIAGDESALAQANQSVLNSIRSAYTQSDTAVRNTIDQFFSNPRSSSPQLSFTVSDSQLEFTVEAERLTTESMLTSWQADVAQLLPKSDLTLAEEITQTNLAKVARLLLDANAALNRAIPGGQTSQATIDLWIASVVTARSGLDTVSAALTNAVTVHHNAQSALEADRKKLALQEAGSSAASLEAAEARIRSAAANVDALRSQIVQMQIIAPASGRITNVIGDVGETVSPGAVVVSMIPVAKLQIDLNLSENNVASVSVGNPARITLDALGETPLRGSVAKIDPAQTIVSGSVYYKTIITLKEEDSRVKAGMTANVWIETGAASSTLVVPASAVKKDGARTFVKMYQGGTQVEQSVTVGLKSQNGLVQIISGLSEGDEVVIGDN